MAEVHDNLGMGLEGDAAGDDVPTWALTRFNAGSTPAVQPGHWALTTPWHVFLRWGGVVMAPSGEHATCRVCLTNKDIVELARLCDGGAAPAVLPLPGSRAGGRRFVGGNPSLPENWPFLA